MEEVVARGSTTAPPADDDLWPSLRRCFRLARDRRPEEVTEHLFAFAGRSVCLSVAGRALAARVHAALAHLETETEVGPEALRIEIWDEDVTGVPVPAAGESRSVQGGGRIVSSATRNGFGAYDRAACHLVAGVRSATGLTLGERARPLQDLLFVWYVDRGAHLAHASMISTRDGRGVLVIGAGREGKSTAAYACARAGFAFVGDDCIAVERDANGRFTGFGVYSTNLVDGSVLDTAEHAEGRAADDERGRQVVYFSPLGAMSARASAQVHAILLPVIRSGAGTDVRRLARGHALRKLLPRAFAMDPRGAQHRINFGFLTDLIDAVPCYDLLAGSDLGRLPEVVAEVAGGPTPCAS